MNHFSDRTLCQLSLSVGANHEEDPRGSEDHGMGRTQRHVGDRVSVEKGWRLLANQGNFDALLNSLEILWRKKMWSGSSIC